MKIRVHFDLVDTKEAVWWREIEAFPKLIKFLGKNFEWITYDKDPSGRVDYIMNFCELPSYDPNYNSWCASWQDMFGDKGGCECGSKYDRHSPNGHMNFCKMWSKY